MVRLPLSTVGKDVYKKALRRGLFASFVTGGATFFTALASVDDWRVIASLTGVAVFSPLVARFGWEGTIDAKQAEKDADNAQ